MAVTMISLSSVLLVGSFIFKIDEVITVQGQLKSIGGNIDVKTPAAGKISDVYFQDGALVQKGDKLIKFDTTEAVQLKQTYLNLLRLETETFSSHRSQYLSELSSLDRRLDVLNKRLETQNSYQEMDVLVQQGFQSFNIFKKDQFSNFKLKSMNLLSKKTN